jgi:hypothetical protein
VNTNINTPCKILQTFLQYLKFLGGRIRSEAVSYYLNIKVLPRQKSFKFIKKIGEKQGDMFVKINRGIMSQNQKVNMNQNQPVPVKIYEEP